MVETAGPAEEILHIRPRIAAHRGSDLAQTFAPLDSREKSSVWPPEEIGADLEAAIAEIRTRSEEILPVWVGMTILFAEASQEWELSGPGRSMPLSAVRYPG